MGVVNGLSDEEGKPYIEGIADGSYNIPVSCSSFKLLKPTIDEVDQHCSLDILPILLDPPLPENLKCPSHSSHAPDMCSISMFPEGGNSLQCASVMGFLKFLKVSNPSKSQMCMDAQFSCKNCIDLQTNGEDSHPSCIIDIDLEKGYIQAPESEEAVPSLKREGILAVSYNWSSFYGISLMLSKINYKQEMKVFRRQGSLKGGGKLIQLLFNHDSSRDNPVIEKIHETPNNRWRRCKRTASFDSRKVVFLFSVLSSLGTLVLIYLTLRVRQSADGYIHV